MTIDGAAQTLSQTTAFPRIFIEKGKIDFRFTMIQGIFGTQLHIGHFNSRQV